MASIAELRERLKAKRSTAPALPYRTCVEVLLKMNKMGYFGSAGLVFSLDGQEVMTESILKEEIPRVLDEEFHGRCRISELSRSLNVSEDIVADCCKALEGLTVYLSDVMSPLWFESEKHRIPILVDKAGGEMKIVSLAERMGLSLDLFSRSFDFSEDLLVVRTNNQTIVSKRFMDLVCARVRGTLFALDSPKDLVWIANQAKCPPSLTDLEHLVSSHPAGTLGKDKIFTPHIWIRKQIEAANTCWEKLGWIPLAGLRLSIGPSKHELTEWIEGHGLVDKQDCLILSSCIVKMTRETLFFVREYVCDHKWIDAGTFIGAKLGCPVDTRADKISLANFLKTHIVELRSGKWIQWSQFLVSQDLISELGRRSPSQFETLLERDFGITDGVFEPMDELKHMVETERERLADLKQNRSNPERLEQDIVERFFDVVEGIAALKYLGPENPIFVQALRTNTIVPLVDIIFRFAAIRFCSIMTGESAVDHQTVVKALPTVGGQPSAFEKPLLSLDADLPLEGVEQFLKSTLGELSIVVPKKDPRGGSLSTKISVLEEMQEAITCQSLVVAITKYVVHRLSGRRITFISEVYADMFSILPSDIREGVVELNNGCSKRRMIELKDFILQRLE
jgi:hypothetical protein